MVVRAAEDNGGGREAPIAKARVHAGEASIWRKGGEIGMGGDGGVIIGYACPCLLSSGDVPHERGGARRRVGELHAMEGGHPGSHVVPHGSPRAVVGGIMVRRAARRRRTRSHDAMATKAARQPHERHMIDVGTARGRCGGDAGEASGGDGIVKGVKDIGSSAECPAARCGGGGEGLVVSSA